MFKQMPKKSSISQYREELLAQVTKNTQLDNNFILLVILSAIVAAVGLLENNVAVIAPLLGPNIAFSLGTSLGERKLVIEALKAMTVGISLAILLAIGIGLLWNGRFDSIELIARTDVAYSSTVIALRSIIIVSQWHIECPGRCDGGCGIPLSPLV